MTTRFGLRTEIILHITLLLGAALLFGGFLMLKLTERELVDQRVTSLSSAAEVVGSALGDMLGAEPESSMLQPHIARLLQPLSSGMTTVGVWKWSANTLTPVHLHGPEIAAFDSKQQLTSMRYIPEPQFVLSYSNAWLSLGRTASSYYKVTMPLYSKGSFVGVLQMRFPLDGVGHRVRTSFKILLVYVFLYGTVLFVFGLHQLNRNVLRPICSLMASTRQVADGNLDEKVSEAGPTEISSLATSFNLMVDALRSSRQRADEHILSLQKANRELKQTRDELLLSEKMASIGHLAAGMAHEIGNPLAAVVGYLGLLKSELPDGRQRDIVGHADKELQRIDQLVRDVLDYAKPVSDQEENLDPVQVARQAIAMLDRQGLFETVILTDDLPGQLPDVRMVPHRLLQVCVNLLVNARDASPSMAKIKVSGGADDTNVWLAIADEGPGIPETNLRYIFDPFYTTKAPGKGRGLGLSVCHRVVDEVGGAIEVQSKVGTGSVFKVVLKRETDNDAG